MTKKRQHGNNRVLVDNDDGALIDEGSLVEALAKLKTIVLIGKEGCVSV